MSNQWPATDPRVPPLVSAWFPGCDWQSSSSLAAGRRVAVVTSRRSRVIDWKGTWLTALRAAVAKIERERNVLVGGHGTAGARLLQRAALRSGCPLLEVHESSANDLVAEVPLAANGAVRLRLICMQTEASVDRPSADWQRTPVRDRAAIAWADEVIALGVRPGGNLHILLRERLRAGVRGVLLTDLPDLQPRAVRKELLSLGAELWSPVPSAVGWAPLPDCSRDDIQTDGQECPSYDPHRLRQLPAADGWDFLTHTTRACPGAWPGQTDEDYLDSLLDGRADADHAALGTLIRIVTQRRLIASNRLIRGGRAVVSFTAAPLIELPQLHRFRGHLARWDFEPYGICLRREWLEQRGAHRVLHGGESEWHVTPPADRPFFQCVREFDRATWSGGAPPDTIDWSAEREWRHVGDLDFSDAAAEDVLLFVPTTADARRLAAVCPWPITILSASPGD